MSKKFYRKPPLKALVVVFSALVIGVAAAQNRARELE
jgi:hypothetical protein